MKQNKKKSNVGSIIIGILMIVIGILFLIVEMPFLTSEPTDLQTMLASGETPKSGDFVSVKVDAVLDWYAETKHTINGFIPAGKEQHCIVWVDDTTFISLTVKSKKNIETIDSIIDDTYAYLNGEAFLPSPVTFKGKVESIGSEVVRFWNEAMGSGGLDIQYDPDFTVINLTIDTTETKAKTIMMTVFFIAIGLVCFLPAILASKKKKEDKAFQQQAAAAANNAQASNLYGQNGYGNDMYGQNNQQNMYDQNNQQNMYGNQNMNEQQDMYNQNGYNTNDDTQNSYGNDQNPFGGQ